MLRRRLITFSLVIAVASAIVARNAHRAHVGRPAHAQSSTGGLARINTTGNCTGTGSSGSPVDCDLYADGTTVTGTGSAGAPFSANVSLVEFEFAGLFGNGLAGSVTISADTTLSSDMMYQNLTVDAGKTLTTTGYRVFVRDTLTLNGVISAAGNAGTNGNNGSSAVGSCAAVSGGAAGTTGMMKAGNAGASSGTTGAGGNAGASSSSMYATNAAASTGAGSTGVGNNGQTLANSGRGGGGASGGGFVGTPSSAGGASGPVTCSFCFLQHEYLSATSGYRTDNSQWDFTGTGGGGGSCGKDTTSSTQTEAGGGGGGGAGGWLVVQTKKLVLGGSGYFDARGGNGGNGGSCGTHAGNSGGGGGGGGGAGGHITLVLGSGTLPADVNVKVDGGTGGTGGTACAGGSNGGNGGTGSVGTRIEYKAGY